MARGRFRLRNGTRGHVRRSRGKTVVTFYKGRSSYRSRRRRTYRRRRY